MAAPFREQVRDFGAELEALMRDVLAQDLAPEITYRSEVERATVNLASKKQPATMTVGRRPMLRFFVEFGCRPDSEREHLAVTKSVFSLGPYPKGEPLFRLEYQDDMRTAPSAHWQVHAERADLTQILVLTGNEQHRLSTVHLPVGGTRFRPCLEDFLQLAIDEFHLDTAPSYRQALEDGRRTWRIRQLKATVRDTPSHAVDQLRRMGYGVTPPKVAVDERDQTLTQY